MDTENDELGSWTEEALDVARKKIAALTPQAYLEMEALIETMGDADIHEAGGIVFSDFIGKNGARLSITARGPDPVIALDRFVVVVRHARMYGLRLAGTPDPEAKDIMQDEEPQVVLQPAQQPQFQQPAAQPIQVGNAEVHQVASLTRKISTNGIEYLTVKTVSPKFSQYGVSAWPETIPPGIDIAMLSPGVIPHNMAYALIEPFQSAKAKNGVGYKVKAFRPAP